MRGTLRERLEAKIDRSPDHGGCWIFTGYKNDLGYGQISGEGRRLEKAHRAAYRLLVGAIPDGLVLDHLCRNASCVNPDHLEAVTQRENTLRSPIAPTAINARKTHCIRGHEFTPENTYTRQSHRWCRVCLALRKRKDWKDRGRHE